MASFRWKIANTPSQGVILTKSNGTEIELIQELIHPDTGIIMREGGCIRIPGEADPVKLAGFRHGGGNPPAGIFYKRWNPPAGAAPGTWISQPDGGLFEVSPADYDIVNISNCPPGRRHSRSRSRSRSRLTRKTRKSRRSFSGSRRVR